STPARTTCRSSRTARTRRTSTSSRRSSRSDGMRRLRFLRGGAWLAVLFVMALGPSRAEAWHRLPPGTDGFRAAGFDGVRGVTVGPIESSLFPGRGYGSESSAALLDFLARRGVNWISITPFGRLWDLSSTEIRMDFEAPYEDNRR